MSSRSQSLKVIERFVDANSIPQTEAIDGILLKNNTKTSYPQLTTVFIHAMMNSVLSIALIYQIPEIR
jgi:hypothetical protein